MRGRYDGTVGVMGGLEAIRSLHRADYRPRRSIELLIFTSEEPTRFGIGCLGSRLLAGLFDASAGESLKDKDGKSLDEVRAAAGFSGPLSDVRLPRDYYSAFVELHIEQVPILEQHNTALGVVTAIAAPASLRISIEGEGGHAGAVLMPDRRDAFLAAAEIALAVEAAARSTGARDTVATVGVCNVFPGAINSIPSRVQMEVDVRDIDQERRDGVLREIAAQASEVAARRKVRRKFANAERRSTGAVRSPNRECACASLPNTQLKFRANDQPRLSRFTFHVARRANRHAIHTVPRRGQPSAR